METSLTLTDQLARAYREARMLVLGDRTPKADRAFALHRDFLAILGASGERAEGPISDWQAILLERTRRAIILALRRQAAAITNGWVEQQGSLDPEQPPAHGVLAQALELATAAEQLHASDDPDASRTAQVMALVRQHIARERESSPSRPPWAVTVAEAGATISISPSVPTGAVMLPDYDSAPPHIVEGLEAPGEVTSGGETVQGPPAQTRTTETRSRLPLLAAASLVVAVGIAWVLLRSGGEPRAAHEASTVRPASAVAAPQAPAVSPSRPQVTALLIRSEPGGAGVTIDGAFRGVTPLSLDGRPGDAMQIVVRKGTRAWHGDVRVGREPRQIVTIRLLPPKVVPTPRPQPTVVVKGPRERFDASMRRGTELYKGGWFGPAAAQFKEAVAIDPQSAHAHLWLGRALARADRHAEARRALEKVIELARTGPAADEAAALLHKLP